MWTKKVRITYFPFLTIEKFCSVSWEVIDAWVICIYASDQIAPKESMLASDFKINV